MSFPVAPAPTAAKLRGGYYTPPAIAAFLADWVAGSGPRVLEPACGDGAILGPLAQRARNAVGIELEPEEADKARAAAPTADVIEADFFEWFSDEQRSKWDGVGGNPPFIRFQHWTEPTRSRAFDVMRGVGMRPTKLTNAWVPFVIASALAVRPGGRLGLVVPAELLQVTYAAETRAFLVDEFAELTAITFKRLVFDRVLQEVVLLLGVRESGPASIRVVEVEDATSLPSANEVAALPHAPALKHESEKWTKYFLDFEGIAALREAREHEALLRLSDLAEVDVGIVTGRNQFFVLRPSDAADRQVERHTMPLVSKSAHLRGVVFAKNDLTRLRKEDALCQLLAVTADVDLAEDEALDAYVAAGEAEGVHQGYKCSIRKRWWVVPSVWTPDAFLLRQIYDHPRIIANSSGATSTDTIHRVKMLNGLLPARLAAASINSITFAFAEVMGRSYGGGVLELEPTEAEGLPFPDPHALAPEDVGQVDKLLRAGELVAALDFVDRRLLTETLRFDEDLVATLRRVWERLRDRRLTRGRR
ncbi:MAG: class I SAM-dependent methyltransferase [Gaiellaceae bacterium MAG52_C11]|nr:class I SAM-dependent methyltransferase [Candidatus Gaiellasilicea maunaloa]